MKRLVTTLTLLLVVGITTAQRAKYVFYFIGDGLGINHIYGTELYNAAVHPQMPNQGRMSFSTFPLRTYITNHASSSLVTDSSAAATALASGVKTVNGYLGVDENLNSVKTIAEIAAERGMKVGVVSNVGVNHATPSAFYAHDESRDNYGVIFEQLVLSKVDFAAGSTILCKKRDGKTPADYIAMAEDADIEVVQTPAEAAQQDKRVLLLSDNLNRREMKYATDRTEGDVSIVDYTAAAIEYLERKADRDGFFLMVEAGHIDHCAHDNDVVTTFEEINDLSKSVQLALDFYAKHPKQTLIIVTSDHETGGLAVGYSDYVMNPEYLTWQNDSVLSLTDKMQRMRDAGDVTWEDMVTLLKDELGLWVKVPLRSKDESELRECFEKNFLQRGEKVVSLYNSNEKMASLAIEILNKRAKIKWVSLDHTGMQVPLYVKGAGLKHFGDCYDNTDVPKAIAEAMGTTLEN